MAEVGVERLGSGDGEEDCTNRNEGDVRRVDQERHDVMRADCQQDFRIVHDVVEPEKADGQEPQRGNGSEHQSYAAGAKPLYRKHDRQDGQCQRHHIGLERRRDDIHTFDRRQYRDCRRNDGVAKKKRRADDADAEDHRRAGRETVARQRHQRQHPALAAIVGTEHEHDVFDGDGDRQRPDDQREYAEDVATVGDVATGRCVQRLAKCIDRAGAYIAINDT